MGHTRALHVAGHVSTIKAVVPNSSNSLNRRLSNTSIGSTPHLLAAPSLELLPGTVSPSCRLETSFEENAYLRVSDRSSVAYREDSAAFPPIFVDADKLWRLSRRLLVAMRPQELRYSKPSAHSAT